MKNIVICCDGTGNEFRARRNTNVVRLFQALEKGDPRQVAYYDPGLGTEAAPGAQTPLWKLLTKLGGLVFGLGLTKNLADAYTFLMRQHEPGDRVFLFGFSRGAYTVRALAGLLHFCGLLERGSENLVPFAIKVYTQRRVLRPSWAKGAAAPLYYLLWIFLWLGKRSAPDWARASSFKRTFCRTRKVEIHFLGLWDTVKSVGWFRRRVTLPHTAKLTFVRHARHAVSIDERRSQYRPNLWRLRQGEGEQRDMQQVWFAGVHSDVGGSYQEAGLADITLEWMLDAARGHGLRVDDEEVRRLKLRPDPVARLHEPLLPFWWLLGWRRRRIPRRQRIHHTVRERQRKMRDLRRPYRIALPASCSWTEEETPPRRLAVGESHRTPPIEAYEKLGRTGLEVADKESYLFEVEIVEPLRDKTIDVEDTEGFPSESQKGLTRFLLERAEPRRRDPQSPWFHLIGTVGETEADHFPIGAGGAEHPIPIEGSGELFCFLNDHPRYYGNNRGRFRLRVTRAV